MFESFRGEFGYTYYGEKRTSASIDIPLAAVVYTCVLISIATIVAAAGIRGKARWYTLIRVVYSLAVGSTLLLCLFGDCWIEGVDDKVSVPYIYRSDAKISGQVGLNIGLQKINITLKGTFQGENKGTVKYNEAIPFGAVGAITDFREFLERGLPQPVLTVVEFFSVDAGGLRWGRSFAFAGYFVKILLLTAFAFWILANIMICSVIFYGGVLFTLTGITMVTSTIVYHALMPSTRLRFFCSESEFFLHYGVCFWAILFMGIFATIVGLVILFLDTKMPTIVQKFFLIEIHDDSEDAYETQKISAASSSVPLYRKNDFKRHSSSPSLANSAYYSASSSDIYKTSTLYSVAEVEGGERTPQMRRSCTNPANLGHLRNSYSLESLRTFSERNNFHEVLKDNKQMKANPLFTQNEKQGESPNLDVYSKKRMGSIPNRLQSAMSLESLPSIPDERILSYDSGMDNDDNDNDEKLLDKSIDENVDDSIDVSIFENEKDTNKLNSSNDKHTNERKTDKEKERHRCFSLNIDDKESDTEERLRGIYIDMSSVYP